MPLERVAVGPGEAEHVGEVALALAIRGTEPRENGEQHRGGEYERHLTKNKSIGAAACWTAASGSASRRW